MAHQAGGTPAAGPLLNRAVVGVLDGCGNQGWSQTVDAVAEHTHTQECVSEYFRNGGDRLLLYHSLMSVQSKVQRIKGKFRGERQAAELEKFMGVEYRVPIKKCPQVPLTPTKQKLKVELETVKSDLKKARRTLYTRDKVIATMDSRVEQLQSQLEAFTMAADDKDDDSEAWTSLQEKYNVVSQELQHITAKLHETREKLARLTPRNANKREKRKDLKLEEQQQEIDTLKEETSMQVELLQAMATKLQTTVNQKTALQKRASHLKIKLQNTGTVDQTIESNEVEIEELRKRVANLERENECLQAVSEIIDDNTVQTFCNGKYTHEMREVILELLTMNVSANNASKVIKCVIEKLTSLHVDKLPSYATCLMIGIEGRLIALMQASKAVTDTGGGSVLANDGTSREKRQYNVTQVGTNKGVLTLGVREMVGEDAVAVLDCSKSVLDEGADLLAKLQNTKKEEELLKMVSSCNNTMSDMGAVMIAFNREYEDWRSSVLATADDFDNMTSDEKDELLKVENFYCFMHVHINQATYAEESLKLLDQAALEVNKESLPGNYRPTSSSSTSAAIHAAAKSFERHGDQQAGQTAEFEAYLDSQGHRIMFKRNVGNRAQILFENAAAYVYHLKQMKAFLSIRKGHAPLNNLLQAVVCHAENRVATAGAHALGILYYAASQPMWLVQEKSEHIFELNPRAQEMEEKFRTWAKDASPLVHERARLFQDIPEESMSREMAEAVYLMPDSETEELTIKALELICQNWQILVQRMLHDRLEGGKYSTPTPQLYEKARNVPLTNKGCERTFSVQDSIMHNKPNSKLLHQESMIMTKQNKTVDFLSSSAEREEMWDLAIKEAPNCVQESHSEQARLMKARQVKIHQMSLKTDLKNLKQRTERSELLSTVVSWGGEWRSAEEVDAGLTSVTGNKKAAVVAQLKLQKKILGSTVPKDKLYLFQQTRRGKPFSQDELVTNLKEIILLNPHSPAVFDEEDDEPTIAPYTVIPPEKRQELLTQQKLAMADKLKKETARMNAPPSARPQKKQPVPLPSDPTFLVGRTIEHKFDIVEKDGLQKRLKKNIWYTGTVNRIISSTNNIFETIYEVCYDIVDCASDCESDDEDNEDVQNTFHYQLLLDYVEGDLKLID